jgi:hypothetical protein
VDKKYIIVLIVAVVAAAGFFIFKNHHNEKALKAHENKQYNRMIQAANKSSLAGLSHMGRALNKYRKEKGAYPEKLSALYPDYIPSKAFIDKVQWHYERRGKDFYLKKTIDRGKNKVMTAAIRSDLKPVQDTMVASAPKPKPLPVPAKTKPIVEVAAASLGGPSAKKSKLIDKIELPPASASEHENDLARVSPKKPTKSSTKRESLSTEELSEKEHFIDRVRGGFLVWKNNDGTLGFGNVQYPISDKMTIYDGSKWVQIHRRGSSSKAGMANGRTQADKTTVRDGLTASDAI